MTHLDSILLSELAAASAEVDQQWTWPEQQLDRLAQAGELQWVVPREYGGLDCDGPELIARYREVAAACLTTAFILTQRNGAIQRIAASENTDLKQELLPALGRGETFATVGISHLTTSRQHLGKPAVAARSTDRGYVLDGTIPWVTGAAFAQTIVTGATLDDGRQVLLALEAQQPEVDIRPPVQMLSMTASATTSVAINSVEVTHDQLLAGPCEQVMQQGQGGGTGSLVTSALAAGLCARCLALLQEEAARRPDLAATVHAFEHEYNWLDQQFQAAAPSAATIRQLANSLAMRISQACLAVTKGAGFISGQPAERAVREAMFFLVWSCPQPVVAAALEELSCPHD
ncbi:MAG: acyl-CoA/acyl-ACP dehydrogenase [Planctomycetaceae bacterium]|nr:acyl-CoA/acyl-ACP dehydrogenase [Planctomycetaceae bacterium]